MSPIGRIFIVLNLILAATFLGFASNNLAASDKYKGQFEAEQVAHAATKEAADTETSTMRTQIQELENTRELLRSEKQAEADRADRNGRDLQAERDKGSQMRADLDRITEVLGNYDATIRSAMDGKDQAVAQSREAEGERDDALSAQSDAEMGQSAAEEALARANGQIADLERSLTAEKRHSASLDTQLKTLVDATGVSLAEITALPLIEAAVLQTEYSIAPGLVALNVGSGNGVQRGFTFDIYSGNAYKGQVRVESVRPGMCTALIVRTVAGQNISQGDSATTRL
ncbi:MAG: hypothetical protein QF724_01945 [Planctomycetota bacterium]|nr:hypothetical protein [Planctomycetota bacterium]MDP6519462.1 hypothetical protein [Planctomycetota bacterium]MDP6837675.1 hypothetical protein [Planctomycetota bacterium]MDP6956289.1 hypothetical protein [Planctomycetota bacterium]